MSPTSSLFLELNTAISMYDAMVHTSSPMLVSTRTRSALRGLWISALLYSLPLSVVLSKSSSNHECTLHKFLEDSIKTLISWLQHPTLQHRISLRWPFNPLSRSRPHQTYETIEDEAKYWESAERLQAQLFPYDARCTRAAAKAQKAAQSSQTRQILYYTPRLPPAYRETRETERDLEESWISAKTVMKWHWLVFPDRVHPPALEAARRVKRLSPKDHREIRRIASLVRASDINTAHVSDGKHPTDGVYASLWRRWLDTRDSDVDISFEGA